MVVARSYIRRLFEWMENGRSRTKSLALGRNRIIWKDYVFRRGVEVEELGAKIFP